MSVESGQVTRRQSLGAKSWVSVCEFLRVSTQMSWVNMGKGVWVSDGMKLRAIRDDVHREKFHLYTRKGEFVRSVTYYEGLTAREVRAKMR